MEVNYNGTGDWYLEQQKMNYISPHYEYRSSYYPHYENGRRILTNDDIDQLLIDLDNAKYAIYTMQSNQLSKEIAENNEKAKQNEEMAQLKKDIEAIKKENNNIKTLLSKEIEEIKTLLKEQQDNKNDASLALPMALSLLSIGITSAQQKQIDKDNKEEQIK
jgi:hypothetical protein